MKYETTPIVVCTNCGSLCAVTMASVGILPVWECVGCGLKFVVKVRP